jgi:YfiH family protein
VFYRNAHDVYCVSELRGFDWLIHGFGTRRADIPERFPNLATLKQVHSDRCVAAEGVSGILGCGDALLERTPGAVIAIKTADCIPVLLVDERNRAVSAVHAGWRGTAAEIVRAAIDAMQKRYGTEPKDLHAAIGPGIGECCYEVGPEVAEQFGLEGRVHLDLPRFNREQLLDAGVAPEHVYSANLCTMCRPEEFHSYRRDREAAGRLYSFAGIR